MLRWSIVPASLAATLLILFFSPVSWAENWPQFRGPDGQGHSAATGLPIRWSDTQNVVWKAEIPGVGWSSPVIAEGKVYLTSAVPIEGSATGDLSLRAVCLDFSTGKPLGEVEIFRQQGASAPKIHTKNSHASPTPIEDDGKLFVHFGHQGTACLDLAGKILWRQTSLKYPPVHGNGGSPILTDKALIFSCDGASNPFVAALDRNTGKVLWVTPRGGNAPKKFAFSTPLLITVHGQDQVVSPGSDMVCAYDPASGKEIWRVRYEGYSVIPRPVYGHGLVFLSSGYNSPSLIAIRPDGHGDVTDTHVAWTLTKGAPHTPSPLLVGSELYMISDRGIATCVDAVSGDQVWQERVGGNFSASPLFADGKIYLQSEEGEGIVLKPGKTYEELARNMLGERTLASYAVADGALLIRAESHLFRIQQR